MLQDVFGRRGLLAISCAILTIPVFGLLAFTEVYPLVSTLWLGITYSVAAVSIVSFLVHTKINLFLLRPNPICGHRIDKNGCLKLIMTA